MLKELGLRNHVSGVSSTLVFDCYDKIMDFNLTIKNLCESNMSHWVSEAAPKWLP